MDIEEVKEKTQTVQEMTSGNLMLAGHTQMTLAVKKKQKYYLIRKKERKKERENELKTNKLNTLVAPNLARQKFKTKKTSKERFNCFYT